MSPCGHVWLLCTKIYQGVEVLGWRDPVTIYIYIVKSLLAWPIFLVTVMATNSGRAPSDFAVSLLSLLPVSCLQPRMGKRHNRPLLDVHVCGESMATGQTFGSGTQGPVDEPFPFSLRTDCLVVCLAYSWVISVPDPAAAHFPYLSLITLQRLLVLNGDGRWWGWGCVYMKQCLHGLISLPHGAALK